MYQHLFSSEVIESIEVKKWLSCLQEFVVGKYFSWTGQLNQRRPIVSGANQDATLAAKEQ